MTRLGAREASGRGSEAAGTHRDEDVAGVGVDLVESVAALEVVEDARLVEVVERDHVLAVHVLHEIQLGGCHLALAGVGSARDGDLDLIAVDGEHLGGDVRIVRVRDPHLHPSRDGVGVVVPHRARASWSRGRF